MHALVALDAGRIVGLAHYLFHRNTRMIGMACYMQDLFTDPGMRGRGIGRALIEAVYSRASAAGSTRIHWQTQTTNMVAQRLYDTVARNSGFVVYRHDILSAGDG